MRETRKWWKNPKKRNTVISKIKLSLAKHHGKKLLIKPVTSFYDLVRRQGIYDIWRTEVFMKDNYTCMACKKPGRRKSDLTNPQLPILHAHHVRPFQLLMIENKIATLEEAVFCDNLWEVSNGLTLCITCHFKIPTRSFLRQD